MDKKNQPLSVDQFTKKEIDFLRRKGLFSTIASKIPSTRPRAKDATLSRIYVRDVITGKETRENKTTQKIKSVTREILDALLF